MNKAEGSHLGRNISMAMMTWGRCLSAAKFICFATWIVGVSHGAGDISLSKPHLDTCLNKSCRDLFQKVNSQEFIKLEKDPEDTIDYADKLLSQKNPEAQEINRALDLLTREANSGNPNAQYSLLGHLFYRKDVLGIRSQLFSKALNQYLKNPQRDPEQLANIAFNLRGGFDYVDLKKSDAIFEQLIKKDGRFQLSYLVALAGDSFRIDEVVSESKAKKIKKFANWAITTEFSKKEDQQDVVFGLVTSSFDVEHDKEVKSYFAARVDKFLSLDVAPKDILDFLLNQEVNDFQLIQKIFYKSKPDETLYAYEIARNYQNGWLDAPHEEILSIIKKGIHTYLMRDSLDTEDIDSNPEYFSDIFDLGFTFAMRHDDYDSAKYIQKAFISYVDKNKKTFSKRQNDYLEITALSMSIQLSIWNNDYSNGKDAVSKLNSILMDKFSSLEGFETFSYFRYDLFRYAKSFGDFSLAKTSYLATVQAEYFDSLSEYNKIRLKIMGMLIGLMSNDLDFYNTFDALKVTSFRNKATSDNTLSSVFNALELLRAVHIDRDLNKARDLLSESFSYEDIDAERINQLDIEHYLNVIDSIEKVSFNHDDELTHLKNRFGSLVSQTIWANIKNGRVVSPKLEAVVADFLFDKIKGDALTEEDFFLFQAVQSLSFGRGIDFSQISPSLKASLISNLSHDKGGSLLNYAYKSNAAPRSIDSLKSSLNKNKILIGAIIATKGVLSLAVTNDGFKIKKTEVDISFLRQRKEQLLKSLQGDFAYYAAYDIYSKIYGGLISSFESKDEIIFVPPREFASIPPSLFISDIDLSKTTDSAVLNPVKSEKGRFVKKSIKSRKYRWLVEDFSFYTIPSLRHYAAKNEKLSPPKYSFLGVGDPLLSEMTSDASNLAIRSIKGRNAFSANEIHDALISLPEASDELKTMAEAFTKATLLLRENATEGKFAKTLNDKYEVISFATHAVKFNEVTDLTEPALILSKDNDQDGFLTQTEITKLDLSHTELVILSACNTSNTSSHLSSDPFTGLATAFLAAGSKSVMVSHWPVFSNAAKEISILMHKSKASSYPKRLQEAMKLLLNADIPMKRQPSYWASFSLLGR